MLERQDLKLLRCFKEWLIQKNGVDPPVLGQQKSLPHFETGPQSRTRDLAVFGMNAGG
jgi:hypothetical protein